MMATLFRSKPFKVPPLAKQLEQRLGGNWRAVRDGFGWRWKCDDGREVRPYSQLAPKHDADDESCITVYYDNEGRQVGACGLIWVP